MASPDAPTYGEPSVKRRSTGRVRRVSVLDPIEVAELKNSLRDKSQDRKVPLKEPSQSALKSKAKRPQRLQRPQRRIPVNTQPSKAQFSRLIGDEKKFSSVAGLPKGKDWALRSNASILGGQENYHDKIARGNQTVSFNLSSKKALDEGWIVKTQPDADMEKNNVLEWATGRLQSAIKQRDEENESAKKSGCNKPVIIRYYGDSRRDTLLKLYRKGNETDGKAAAVAAGLLPGRKTTGGLKIPQLSKMENTSKDRFMVQVADGSTTVYYPKTGEIAFMASAVPEYPGQLYTNVFANDENRTCLASFTPYGKSCCYHKNGAPGLILTDQGGLLKNEDGSVLKRWEWPGPGLKLKDNVVFHLNKEMYVRVGNRNNVTLHYTANRETMKMNVGALPGLDGPSAMPDQGNVLRSGYKYSSKAASEFQQSYRKEERIQRGGKKGKQMMRKPVVQSRKSIEVEELKHSLDPPERFQFESQADRELRRLQDKSKHVVDEWMEHYRIAVGLSSPALKKMLDQPVIKGAHRKVQSARERKEADRDESEERITNFQSFRSPSAPPRHMVPGPHAVMVKEDKHRKGATSSVAGMTSRKSHDAHVRIDDTPSVVVESPSKDVISPQRSTQGSRQRPATQGSRTLHRPQRSSMRTSSSAGSGPGKVPEKTWSPAPECCPVVTRNTLLYDDTKHPEKHFTCKCSKHRIPHIHDLELDYYLRMVAPVAQLVVICVVNTLYPQASPYDTMFDKLYVDRNKNRSKPCSQSRHDQYRILRYDLAVAKLGSNRPAPLLLGRHNVVPGMTLMYCGGRLLFADHIFNGYGNARNDFRKQVYRTKREFLLGHFLPDDFRFTPGRGKAGSRAAWGGQMGGAGVDGKGSPGLFFNNPGVKAKSADFNPPVQSDETRSLGDVTSDSTLDLKMQTSKSFDTARDFVQFTLSTKMYVIPPSANHKRSRTRIDHRSHSTATSRYARHNSSFPPAGATPHSSVNDDGSLRQLSSFSRLQTVK